MDCRVKVQVDPAVLVTLRVTFPQNTEPLRITMKNLGEKKSDTERVALYFSCRTPTAKYSSNDHVSSSFIQKLTGDQCLRVTCCCWRRMDVSLAPLLLKMTTNQIVLVDEQHFWSALWTVADADLYHVLLTRQEGYRVVSWAALGRAAC